MPDFKKVSVFYDKGASGLLDSGRVIMKKKEEERIEKPFLFLKKKRRGDQQRPVSFSLLVK